MKPTVERIVADFRMLTYEYLKTYFVLRETVGPEQAQQSFKDAADEFMTENAGVVDMDSEHDRRVAILAAVYLLVGVIVCSGACENGGQ